VAQCPQKNLTIISLLMFSTVISNTVWAEMGSEFSRPCNVYDQPQHNSRVVCRVSPGELATNIEKDRGSFYRVELGARCAGYVPDSCLNLPNFHRAKLSDMQADNMHYHRFQVGPTFDYDLLFAKSALGTDNVMGMGFGGGLQVDVPLLQRLRISPTGKYVNWMMKNSIQPGASVLLPTDNFTETLSFISAGGMLSLIFTVGGSSSSLATTDYSGNVFWLNAGFEYLFALSGQQSLNGVVSQLTTPVDNAIVTAGFGIDWSLTRFLMLGTHVAGQYAVIASPGTRIFGAKGHVSLSFGF
jgi:hypothetical protein